MHARRVHRIERLDHRDPAVAADVVRLQRAAYRVEADLIGFDGIPPLHESAADVTALDLTLLGAHDEGRLVGVVGYERRDGLVDVHRLAVDPAHHRRGVGRGLLHELHRREEAAAAFEVSTGAANAPAIELYLRIGYRSIGTEHLPAGLVIERFRRDGVAGS